MIKNPLIKLVGIIAIVYFALFYDSGHKDSLKKRLSSKNIKRNIDHIKDKTVHIKQNIDKVKIYEEKLAIAEILIASDKSYQNLVLGFGNEAKCGDVVLINYNKLIDGINIPKSNYQITINYSSAFSEQLIGMKPSGVRKIFVKEDRDGLIEEFVYEVKLIKIITQNNEKNDQKCS